MFNKKKNNTNIEFYIDSLNYDDIKGRIQGWAIDKETGQLPKIQLTNVEDVRDFQEMDRIDIQEKYNTEGNENLGFGIDFILDEDKNPVLTLEDSQGNIENVKLSKHNSILSELQKANFFRKQVGLRKFLPYYLGQKDINWREYDEWFHKNAQFDYSQVKSEEKEFKNQPLISIVMPVYNVDRDILEDALDSVLMQTYPNWELCIADDHSTNPEVREVLEKYEGLDPRIKVTYRSENGHIAEATNTALGMVNGDYIVFMDNDDIIQSNTLHEYIKLINEYPDTDLIYCDEDFINNYDFHYNPFFKPDFNERLFYGHNCITHMVMVKREILDQVGGLRSKTNGAQDYDFLLRVLDKTNNFKHVEKVLYNWRMTEKSVAGNPHSKDYAYTAGQKAIQDYFNRNNIPATVHIGKNIGTYSITRDDQPGVSILLAFDPNQIESTYKTLESLFNNTDYPNKELVLINFNKDDVQRNLPEINFDDSQIRFVQVKPGTINENLSDAVYLGYPENEYLLIAKAGIVPEKSDWLEKMANETAIPSTGLVTPMYLNEDDKIISAGYYYDHPSRAITYPGNASNKDDLGYFYRTELPQNVEGNYSEIYLIHKDDFKKLKELDKYQEPLAGLNLTEQIQNMGKKVVMTPDVRIYWSGNIKDFYDMTQPKVLPRQPLQEENFNYFVNYTEPEKVYSNDIVKRYRRSIDKEYRGLDEFKNV